MKHSKAKKILPNKKEAEFGEKEIAIKKDLQKKTLLCAASYQEVLLFG